MHRRTTSLTTIGAVTATFFSSANLDQTRASRRSTSFACPQTELGSTGTRGISQRCGVIDSGFRSEWMIPLTNLNKKPLVLVKPGKEDLFAIVLDTSVVSGIS